MSVDKIFLRAAIVRQLQAERELQVRAAQLAHDEATNEQSRAENKYDTRGQEAAYLAEGQARIATEIDDAISLYATLPLPTFTAEDGVAVGAIIQTDDGRRRLWYFLGPRAGGLEIAVGEKTIFVITPLSPLGRKLLGRRVGDVVSSPGSGPAGGQRIVSVA